MLGGCRAPDLPGEGEAGDEDAEAGAPFEHGLGDVVAVEQLLDAFDEVGALFVGERELAQAHCRHPPQIVGVERTGLDLVHEFVAGDVEQRRQ